MSGDLYGILHISREASPEEIRKAYKKRALQTHPDRLPANYTPAEKTAAEDKFRKVNNAYEILKDPEKRQSYDRYGAWPPPAVPPTSPHNYSSRYRPYTNDFSRPRPDPFTLFTDFHFTDPFELFDSFFHDSLGVHSHDRRDNRFPRRHTTYEDSSNFAFPRARDMHSDVDVLMARIDDMHRNMLSTSTANPRMGMSTGMGSMGVGFPPMISHFPTFPRLDTRSGSGNGRWAAESTVSQTVNGVTQTIQKRRDWEGNVHVTRTYPGGRKVVTINGVEQHDQGQAYLPSPPPPPAPNAPSHGNNYLPSPPPPYSSNPNSGAPRSSAERPVIPVVPSFRNVYEHEDRTPSSPTHPHTRTKWWNRHG
ncbi:hypothetical protein DFJ43DRAFT_1075274 [Lentinula guzmanii]|uniref:J domain-containing protein n=1 Tax=Lentinula guzmanii TaxID=2804957 RepID=A0AA38JH48_9AGAR|nr:hypothetical protein DFJ43DRAFT_1075274 [Lentinula guzmanii]